MSDAGVFAGRETQSTEPATNDRVKTSREPSAVNAVNEDQTESPMSGAECRRSEET